MVNGQFIRLALKKENGDIQMNIQKDKRTFTDGERSAIWGVEQVELDTLRKAGVPFCYYPKKKRAVILFDGRRRFSSVAPIYDGAKAQQIRSKKAIIPYLNEYKELSTDELSKFWKELVYGFGVTWTRLTSEYFPSVEIARIILEFKFDSLKKLNDYVLSERPELFSELTQRHGYYTKIINEFKSVDRLEEINESIKEGFAQLIKSKENPLW